MLKEFHPEQLKKLSGTLSKVDLNFDNFELWMTHNYPLRSKDPRDSVVVLIENSTFFPFFKFDFRHEYDEILNIFSFD